MFLKEETLQHKQRFQFKKTKVRPMEGSTDLDPDPAAKNIGRK
jgi:hypothetical protein